jgi:putative peptidoglycan binding protein
MKRILYSICIGSLALALTASAAPGNKAATKGKGKARVASVQKSKGGASMRSAGHVRAQRSVSAPRLSQRSYRGSPKVRSNAVARQNNLRSDRMRTVRERNLSTRTRTAAVTSPANVTTKQARSVTRNVAVNNNWRGSQFSGQNYAAFRNYSRTYHDRSWWDSNYSRISFYFGAPYYWDSGYWYPAWGYYPDYVYDYDGPIYGYNGLAPDRVVIDVQTQLRRDGYYTGPIDGILGRMTRRAITAFQADHGLAITSSIDQPTLATLGLG